jgi:hypothetical protein
MWISFVTIRWQDSPCPVESPWRFCQIPAGLLCVARPLDAPSCVLFLACPPALTTCLDYWTSRVRLDTWECTPSNFILFKITLALLGHLHVHMNFRISLSILVNKTCWNFDWDCQILSWRSLRWVWNAACKGFRVQPGVLMLCSGKVRPGELGLGRGRRTVVCADFGSRRPCPIPWRWPEDEGDSLASLQVHVLA